MTRATPAPALRRPEVADHLTSLRLFELERVLPWIPARSRVLELGAGTGVQARALSGHGHRVAAVDVPGSVYAPDRVWPVLEYDGRRLPFADAAFDVVFSSNVLEHVVDLDALQAELRRVLVPGGRAVHVLPTPSWRWWTTLAHPFHLARRAAQVLPHGAGLPNGFRFRVPTEGKAGGLLHPLLPRAHGQTGNFLTELYHFSSRRWRRHFERSRFRVVHREPTRLLYSGYALLGPRLGLRARERWSLLCGSACLLWVLERER